MTVNTTNITSGPYAGNGVADTFSYTFRIDDKSQISVYETDDAGVQSLLVVDTDYTVTGIGVDAGGTVVRTAGALPTGYEWYVRSDYDETQLTAFASQGGFFPDVHEKAFDKLTFLIQQIIDQNNRSIKYSDSESSGAITEIASIATRANKALGFTSTGDLTYLSGTMPVGTLREYSTLAAAVADVANISVDDVIILKERTAGNGGGATWDAVDATTVTENEYNIVTGSATVSFHLREGKEIDPLQWGAASNTAALQAAFDTGKPIKPTSETYTIDADITLTADLDIRGTRDVIITGSAGTEKINSNGFSIKAKGVKFSTLGTVINNTGSIPTVDIRNCEFDNVTKLYDTSAAANTLSSLVWLNNEADSCGRGLFVQNDTILYAHVDRNKFTSLSYSGGQNAAVRIGNDVNSAVYPATRRDITVTNNHIDTITATSTLTRCWGISVFGDHSIIKGNYIKDITVGDSNGAEGIYTKSRYGSVSANVLIDAADSSAQGAITIKGDTSSTRGQNMIVSDNQIYSDGTPSMYGIWLEISNCITHDNMIDGTSLGGIGVGQRTITNVSIHHNMIFTTGRYGVNVTCDGSDFFINNNEIMSVTDSGANASSYGVIVQSQAASIDNLHINGNKTYIESTSTTGVVGGVAVTTQTAKPITNVHIKNNDIVIPSSLTPTTRGVIVQGVADIITGLYIKGNKTNGTDEGVDLQVSAKDLHMSDNDHELISTTDATATTTLRIPLSDESLYQIEAEIVGKQDTTGERCMYKIAGLFYRDGGGVATLQGSLQSVYSVETTAGLDGTLSVSGGNDVLARVTGIAATNMTWLTKMSLNSIS